ncbi:UbiA family prenyltransferase [Halocatena salina]|uniref:UbiA family prenyltransferase n=1 Tax=Halocatena salina TaxID=2934340 RepID=A0A8U0A8F7_9EURY|nr:UbiA family prenyltransferase [Halocatena salina]UPM44313.1 UbiA family prenyltransferase [Halocatena salina]
MIGTAIRRTRAYATLVRLPNLFTAPPDVVAGVALAVGVGGTVTSSTVFGLAVASMLLYAAGTTLNDYFDASDDAHERPERPIPSGEVARPRALALGLGFLAAGVVTAVVAAGTAAGVISGLLALTVLLYDGVLTGSAVGCLAMGAMRGLNVCLGVTAALSPVLLPRWALAVPIIVTAFITGVTWTAAHETGTSDRTAVVPAIGGVVVAVLGTGGLLLVRSPRAGKVLLAVILLACFLGWTGRALRSAVETPTPETIGAAVGACVLGLPVLESAFAATIDPVLALLAAAFVVPAMGFARVFSVS